jgi:hypothetical protein
MQRILLLVSTFVVSCSPILSQGNKKSATETVESVVVQLFDALSHRDSVQLKAACTKDVVFYEYGMVWNIDTLIRKAIRLNRAADFKRINTLKFINTRVDKRVAWTTYYNNAEITRGGTERSIRWLETVVLIRERKKWKVKLLHSTSLKP